MDKEISNPRIKKILNIDDTDYFIIFSESNGYFNLFSINITFSIANPSSVNSNF